MWAYKSLGTLSKKDEKKNERILYINRLKRVLNTLKLIISVQQ